MVCRVNDNFKCEIFGICEKYIFKVIKANKILHAKVLFVAIVGGGIA